MKSFTSFFAVAALLLLGGDLQAQSASTPDLESELRQMVAEPATVEQDRAVVREFLDRDDVIEAVGANGLDVDRLRSALNTLDANEVADLADRVEDAADESDLVGGNTIVISATTVIIILLVLILVT